MRKYFYLVGGSFVFCIFLLYIFGAFNTAENKKPKRKGPRKELKAAVVIGNVNISNYAVVTVRKTIKDTVFYNDETGDETKTIDSTYEVLLETIVMDTAHKMPFKNTAGRDSSIWQFIDYPKRMVLFEFDLPK